MLLKINNILRLFFLWMVLFFSNVSSNQIIFEDIGTSSRLQNEFLSEFNAGNENNDRWTNVFSEKSFIQIDSFFKNLPVKNLDEVFQSLIFEILISKKNFNRNKVSPKQDKIIFETIINKLFETGRLNEIELIYSESTELVNNNFILKKMIEGNLLRNRHSEACKILSRANDDPLFFGKVMIICDIINNRFDEAKLGLQLLKEQNQPGDIFFIDLAFSLMSDKDISESGELKKNLDEIKELNPIIMSSLQFADISPNFEQIDKLTTSGLLFILSNPSADTELKIFCSEILVKQGRITVEMLSEAYQLASFDSNDIENADKLYKTLSPIRARPLLYQSIIRDNKPESKFRKIISLIKISLKDNLLPKIAYLIGDLMKFDEYVQTNEEAILISQMYQSKKRYEEARNVLNKNFKSPESDYRNIAIDISEFMHRKKIDYSSLEQKLMSLNQNTEIDSAFIKKVLLVLISNVDLNQSLVDQTLNLSINEDTKTSDFKDLLLAERLSASADYFNSFILLFKIVENKDFMELNLIQSYSVLLILRNLGFMDEFKKLSEKILL
ncbi:MAG: hypothetical protein VX976_00025 [Pseudomonadota bacterium]|nr:hypothetical protein [Pseudomonadota bacterium]